MNEVLMISILFFLLACHSSHEDTPEIPAQGGCGEGTWGSLTVDGATLFVDISADDGGDGQEATPFRTLKEALAAAAGMGSDIAVAAGTYAENVVLGPEHDRVSVNGRCADLAILDASSLGVGTAGVSAALGDGASFLFSGMTVMSAPENGVEIASGDVTLRDMMVVNCGERGIHAEPNGGAVNLVMERVTVARTQPNEDGWRGTGVAVYGGAVLQASDCQVDGNAGVGLWVGDAYSQAFLENVSLTNTAVNTLTNGEPGFGIGALVENAGRIEASGFTITGNGSDGLVVSGANSAAVVTDAWISDTQAISEDFLSGAGIGVSVVDGASLHLTDSRIEDNAHLGVNAGGAGTVVYLDGIQVMGTGHQRKGDTPLTAEESPRDESPTLGGWGIGVASGAALSAAGCLIAGNTEVGVLAVNSETRLELRDTTVRDTQSNTNGEYGRGIGIEDGATLSAADCLLEGNISTGLFASGSGTQVVFQDSTISNTGRGTSSEASIASGVTVQDGARFLASDSIIHSNQGPGVLANANGILECEYCTIQDNQFAGAAALAGSTLTITDSTVEGTSASVNLGGGAGVYAWPWNGGPPTVTLTNTVVQGNPIAGIWLIGEGLFELVGNTIGGGNGESYGAGTICGDAILALDGVSVWDGSKGLLVRENAICSASGAGVFLDESAALLEGNVFFDNTLDLRVQGADCSEPTDGYDDVPRSDICSRTPYPSCYAEFYYVAAPAAPMGLPDRLIVFAPVKDRTFASQSNRAIPLQR